MSGGEALSANIQHEQLLDTRVRLGRLGLHRLQRFISNTGLKLESFGDSLEVCGLNEAMRRGKKRAHGCIAFEDSLRTRLLRVELCQWSDKRAKMIEVSGVSLAASTDGELKTIIREGPPRQSSYRHRARAYGFHRASSCYSHMLCSLRDITNQYIIALFDAWPHSLRAAAPLPLRSEGARHPCSCPTSL